MVGHAVKTGREYPRDDDTVRTRTPETVQKARTYVLRLLEMRDRTTEELSRKMRSKGFAEDVVLGVLEEMKSLGYLDDAKYARHFAETRATYQKFGPVRIRIELERRGIPRELAADAVRQAFEGTGESETALALAREWVARRESSDEPASKRRLYGFLARRGFSSDVAERVIREVLGGG
ncbi:MAG: regulatory protein RecX [Bacillota bacterium]